MAAKRRGLSKKTRFEVFKRDKFSCQYCGKRAPDVVLVIDHIQPVARGGDNVLLNLVTACEPCNAGKGARELSDGSVVTAQRAEADALAVRREQLEMMVSWHKQLSKNAQFELDAFVEHWKKIAAPFAPNETGLADVRKWLRTFPLIDLLSAADTACAQYFQREDGALTLDSVCLGWSKVPGIARISRLPPSERDLYYVRGILRRRLHYCDEQMAMELLRDALDVGVSTDYLKQMARSVRNWTGWVQEMNQAIEECR